MKKKIFFPALLAFGLILLTGCSKVSLTSMTNQGAAGPGNEASMETPPEGGVPVDGQTPPDGGTPPSGGQGGGMPQ